METNTLKKSAVKVKVSKKERPCLVCGKLFKPNSNSQKYHTDCKRIAYRQNRPPDKKIKYKKPGVVLLCAMCGQVNNRRGAHRYCTKLCARKAANLKQYEYKLSIKVIAGATLDIAEKVLYDKIQKVFYGGTNDFR